MQVKWQCLLKTVCYEGVIVSIDTADLTFADKSYLLIVTPITI